MLTLRSLLFTTWVFATGAIGGTAEMFIFWAPHRSQWALAKAWADRNLWAGKFFCGLDVTTEGSENIPDDASVALIKHSTAMENYWPKRGWRKYPGKIHSCIGPAIDPAGRTPKEINELAQGWIENEMLEISSHYKN